MPLDEGVEELDIGDVSGLSFTWTEPYLPEEALRRLSGCNDLADVEEIVLEVDASDNSVGDLGVKLPALRFLRLCGSTVPWLRDLGTHLRHLRVLWANRCGMGRLDGAAALPALEELYAAFNDVSDLAPLAACSSLRVLDLEANCVREAAELQFLAECPDLRHLVLHGTPLASSSRYRNCVRALLPWLASLDHEDGSLVGACGDIQSPGRLLSDSEVCSPPSCNVDATMLSFVDSATDWLAVGRSDEHCVQEAVKLAQARRPPPPPPSQAQRRDVATAQRSSRVSSGENGAGASALTHGSGTVFCGLPTQKLRARAQRCAAEDPSPAAAAQEPGSRAELRQRRSRMLLRRRTRAAKAAPSAAGIIGGKAPGRAGASGWSCGAADKSAPADESDPPPEAATPTGLMLSVEG